MEVERGCSKSRWNTRQSFKMVRNKLWSHKGRRGGGGEIYVADRWPDEWTTQNRFYFSQDMSSKQAQSDTTYEHWQTSINMREFVSWLCQNQMDYAQQSNMLRAHSSALARFTSDGLWMGKMCDHVYPYTRNVNSIRTKFNEADLYTCVKFV